ncbi:MAG: PepSY domain-containing protein [Thiogranum sp.]
MSRQHRRKQRFKLRSFYVWHRYMGVSAALFTLVIAVTGVLLNHTEDFQFDSAHIQSDWILDWYGIEAPRDMRSFRAGDRHITLMGEHLYLNRREIEGSYRELAGALQKDDMFIVVVSDSILLLTQRGELIERLQDEDGIPAGIVQIGLDNNGTVVVRTRLDHYQPDADFLRWSRRDNDSAGIRWATPGPLDPRLKSALQNHFRGEVLPLERVILDMHSGRFFGQLGPWVFDAAAILLILLSLSGTWIWLKRRR